MPQAPVRSISGRWAEAWALLGFRWGISATLLLGFSIAAWMPVFFQHISDQHGWVPSDPVLEAIGPYDVTWLTFTVLYGAMVITIGRALTEPWLMLRGLQAYVWIMVLRVIAMECVTLEPPADIIPLVDPITASFYPGGQPFLKDLFFSGHTASLALMVCLSRPGRSRWFAVASTMAIALLVLMQHVHWTMDVLAAPVFAWLAWRGSAVTLRLCGPPSV
jgi:PAP2 superfamily C-terminal